MDMLEIEFRFRDTAERVFDAWLDPKVVRTWLFATPKGEMIDVQIDPRKGGHYSITERRKGQDVLHTGTYLRLQRPDVLWFTLTVPSISPDTVTVSIEIEPSVDGGCVLMLGHDVKREDKDAMTKGWLATLQGLQKQLSR
ncbi:uncharacterized protein YndB with AHSA1/START domain [Luteibacter sp. Sphag1AF]|uniref:SRPBCC family protein n=1 Tax=Luteibacter sp. Sphag1AF TaxID=2587031 RepID=UPI001617DA0F|nr:SRPBCC family protein [Luteibacter sp. Sphag1AF]MBB3228785.1 uncharacterized protein YndB with AHSA1/START domain [Luteibacter sp. Sphag1AF]